MQQETANVTETQDAKVVRPQTRKLSYTVVVTKSRAGVAYTSTRVIPGFTPSLAPAHNPERDLRRHIEKLGKLSGKQWRNRRRALRRTGRLASLAG